MRATQGGLNTSKLRFRRGGGILAALLSLFLLAPGIALAKSPPKSPTKTAAKKPPEPKEVLIFKNGDQITGKLLNSTGTKIKFNSDVAGDITIDLDKIKELKSDRPFAVVLKEVKGSKKREAVAHGMIELAGDGIRVTPLTAGSTEKTSSTTAAEAAKPAAAKVTAPQKPPSPSPSPAAAQAAIAKPAPPARAESGEVIPASQIGFLVDDATYLKETERKIHWTSGWDGHITTGSTIIRATQNTYLFLVDIKLQRTIPTVSWLDPKLRTTLNYTQSAGQTSQIGTVTTNTNIFHALGERDEYFSPRGYYLQQTSFDHDTTQGLDLQQIYGAGVGVTLFKQPNSELDVTADLHYEAQAFNSTADVSSLNRNLIGSVLSEAYTRKFGKLTFDEKALADLAWNNESAFSASGTTSVRYPVYKKLSFSVAVIDGFQNDPQIGYQKNSFQLSTGISFSLH